MRTPTRRSGLVDSGGEPPQGKFQACSTRWTAGSFLNPGYTSGRLPLAPRIPVPPGTRQTLCKSNPPPSRPCVTSCPEVPRQAWQPAVAAPHASRQRMPPTHLWLPQLRDRPARTRKENLDEGGGSASFSLWVPFAEGYTTSPEVTREGPPSDLGAECVSGFVSWILGIQKGSLVSRALVW